MQLAVETAQQCKSSLPENPLVGAVAVSRTGRLLGTAYRGEIKANDHAEFTLLEGKAKKQLLPGATVYVTLEPCTYRNPGKIPCVQRLVDRRVARVVIGMWDPNPIIRGLGCRKLREAGIITQMFDSDYMDQLEDLNRDFIEHIDSDPVFAAVEEIGRLVRRGTPRQQEASRDALLKSLRLLKQIRAGGIPIEGNEAGYFSHLLSVVRRGPDRELGKAFIMLSAFQRAQQFKDDVFENFLLQWRQLLKEKQIEFQYIFLLKNPASLPAAKRVIDQYRDIAAEINLIYQDAPSGHSRHTVDPNDLRESVVLLQEQKVAFTHKRENDTTLLYATEWVGDEPYQALKDKYDRLCLGKKLYYSRPAAQAAAQTI
jgi:pyrimidine deaminase RibD-like protein